MKTCLVFPGQGSQSPGMGKSYYDSYPEVRDVLTKGSYVTDRDLADLCFNSEPEYLNRTENAQLAIFAISAALFALVDGKGVKFDALAGFSLGECTALYASGMISLEDAFRLVQQRGVLMQQAADSGMGAMCAVLGLDGNTIKALAAGTEAEPVNFNCPGQVVISGTPKGIELLSSRCKEAGAKRIVPLTLSGAFHTNAMATAAQKLSETAKAFKSSPMGIAVYTNLTGFPLAPDTSLSEHLSEHMQSPVLWQSTIENLISDGIASFVEVGAGNTLSRFISKTSKNATVTLLEELI
ncbi:MAG: ACP S-malonyltransferase [Oscillospiraceae bacterium]|nr:ACP S-malonyltransferase [Oscillospiraceae bacterium]